MNKMSDQAFRQLRRNYDHMSHSAIFTVQKDLICIFKSTQCFPLNRTVERQHYVSGKAPQSTLLTPPKG